jgi:hypothetical protein
VPRIAAMLLPRSSRPCTHIPPAVHVSTWPSYGFSIFNLQSVNKKNEVTSLPCQAALVRWLCRPWDASQIQFDQFQLDPLHLSMTFSRFCRLSSTQLCLSINGPTSARKRAKAASRPLAWQNLCSKIFNSYGQFWIAHQTLVLSNLFAFSWANCIITYYIITISVHFCILLLHPQVALKHSTLRINPWADIMGLRQWFNCSMLPSAGLL